MLYLVFLFTFATRSFFQNLHQPGELNENQINTLAQLSNLTHMDEILDNICIERVVGTQQHEEVKEVGFFKIFIRHNQNTGKFINKIMFNFLQYIYNSMKNLGWSVEIDEFHDETPIFGNLRFSNVIAKLNPQATRYLTIACHYDSKYMFGMKFVGAIDSAVPCAQLINTAKVMKKYFNSVKNVSEKI